MSIDFAISESIESQKLTEREEQVLTLTAHGYTSEQIAWMLDISQRTVTTHRSNLMRKTHSNNVAGLVRFAFKLDLIS